MASRAPSLYPKPESLIPPNGDISIRYPGTSQMFTVPTFKFLIKKLAVLRSFVQTPEDNPKAVELETFATSSKSLDTLIIGIIGPKVSSTTNSLLDLT